MTRVLDREMLQGAMCATLAPVLHAVGASLGPNGRGTLHGRGRVVGQALSGVEIGRRCCSEGGVEGLAQVLLRETLVQAGTDLGDGTARLAVMTGAALGAGQGALAAGVDPGALTRRIEALRPDLDAAFAALTRHDIAPGAQMVATGLPDDLQRLLADALETAGPDGQVELTEGQEPGATLCAHGGFVFEAQPIEQTPLDALDDVSLIVADDIITDFRTLAPVIEGFAQRHKALIIAARGVEGSALALLERNRKAGVLTVTALKPADAGPRAAAALEDLAVATGAQLVAERTGLTLSALKPAMLGHAARYSRTGQQVMLGEPGGAPEDIALRLRQIEGDITAARHLSFDLEHARRRHARMKGRWVNLTLNTGDGTATAALLDEARRTLASVTDAGRSGTLPGGGLGLMRVADALCALPVPDLTQRAALAIVAAALRAPARQIARNAGLEAPAPMPDPPLHDPAGLSRILLDQALSLTTRLLSLDRAVLRAPLS